MSQSARKSNKQLVDRALEEILPPALKPFISRKMEDKYGSNWLQNAQRSLEHYYFDGADLKWNDPAAVIKLLQKHWEAFYERNKLDNRERSWVEELRNIRNEIKHNNDVFDYDYSFRALDTMERFLDAAEAKKAAQQVKQLKEQLQKSLPVGVRGEFQAADDYYNLGLIAKQQERFEQAISSFVKALNVFEDVYDTDKHGSTVRQLGKIYKILGEYLFEVTYREVMGEKCPKQLFTAIQALSKVN